MTNLPPPHKRPVYTKCIVCGNVPLTDTHVWPRWLRHVTPKQNNFVDTADIAQPGFHPGPPVRLSSKQRIKRDLFSTAPFLACEKCNGGWMKSFEDEVAPFMKQALTGKLSRNLSQREHEALAGWLSLIAVLAEYANCHWLTLGREPLLYLRDKRTVPPGFTIYVGRTVANKFSAKHKWSKRYSYHSFALGDSFDWMTHSPDWALNVPLDSYGRPASNSQISTMGIGSFLAQLFCSPSETFTRSYEIAAEDSGLTHMWPQAFALWPFKKRTLKFPLNAEFTDNETDILADELHHRFAAMSRAKRELRF